MTRLLRTEDDLANVTAGTIAIDMEGISWQKIMKGSGINYWVTQNNHAEGDSMNDWLPLLVVYEPSEPPLFNLTSIATPPRRHGHSETQKNDIASINHSTR